MAGLAEYYSQDQMGNILADTGISPLQQSNFANALGTDVTGLQNYSDYGNLDPTLLDKTKGVLGNETMMTGLMGAGQLGLGLANYFAQKPMYEEQLKGLRQNRQIQADRYDRNKVASAGFSQAGRDWVNKQGTL